MLMVWQSIQHYSAPGKQNYDLDTLYKWSHDWCVIVLKQHIMAWPYIQHKEKVSEMERKDSDWINNPAVTS